jgi:predicted transcriptional regulator
MVKTTVYLDPELALALRQLADSRGRSQADLIRQAIARYTRRSVRIQPKGVGQYRSGLSDVSERAEHILRGAAKGRRWP